MGRREKDKHISQKNSQMHLAHKQTRLKESSQDLFNLLLEPERHVYNKHPTIMHSQSRQKTFKQPLTVALHHQHNSWLSKIQKHLMCHKNRMCYWLWQLLWPCSQAVNIASKSTDKMSAVQSNKNHTNKKYSAYIPLDPLAAVGFCGLTVQASISLPWYWMCPKQGFIRTHSPHHHVISWNCY